MIYRQLTNINPEYYISEYGDLKRCAKEVQQSASRWGAPMIRNKPEKFVKPRTSNRGYVRAAICFGQTKMKTYSVHRLVAIAFLENPNNLPEVNHKDGNKQNNHFSNLEWCTRLYNQRHAIANGLKTSKSSWDCSLSKGIIMITPDNERSEFGSIGEAGRLTGLKRELISESAHLNRDLRKGRYKGYKFQFL